MATRILGVTLGLIALVGCAEPEFVSNPTPDALKPHLGSRVTVEGIPWMEKEGEMVETANVEILVDIPNSVADNWPSDGRAIRVTGTLEETDRMTAYDYPFRLRSASWVDVEDVTP